jgi:hypothetical protein
MVNVFTWKDVDDGLCQGYQVGLPKPIAQDTSPPMTLVDATEAALNRLGPAKYFEWAEKNANQFFDQAAKQGISQLAKAQSKPVIDLEALSNEDIAALSTEDIKRNLLRAVGITRKDQLLGASPVSPTDN